MATPPVFSAGAVLTAAQMNAVGLWLVKTQTVGTGVTTVTVSNCFTSDFDNYRVIYSGGSASNDGSMGLQVGASGTFVTTGYYGVLIYSDIAGTAADGNGVNNGASWLYAGATDSYWGATLNVDLLGMRQNSVRKRCSNASYSRGAYYGTFDGLVNSSSVMTDIKLIPEAGTLTGGTIYVYGYRQ